MLRDFNNGLSFVVILLCLYLMAAPLVPQAQLKLQKKPPLVVTEEQGKPPEKIPDVNTLVIPRLKMQQQIHESANPVWGLGQGVWRDPLSSSPDLGKNTVFSGHRFTYDGRAVFYHLDKVQKGDRVVVYWNKTRHVYRVADVREVLPTAREVVRDTGDDRVTIYTCTPLLTARNRLVVVAKPIKENP